jgi:hypothetical protein
MSAHPIDEEKLRQYQKELHNVYQSLEAMDDTLGSKEMAGEVQRSYHTTLNALFVLNGELTAYLGSLENKRDER